MSDTPRTDKMDIYPPDTPCFGMVRADFARKLERELNAVTKERDAARAALKEAMEACDNYCAAWRKAAGIEEK